MVTNDPFDENTSIKAFCGGELDDRWLQWRKVLQSPFPGRPKGSIRREKE